MVGQVPRYLLNFNIRNLPQEETDVLIIGSGITGLYIALKVAPGCDVILVTKDRLDVCATDLAQGGIAAAIDKGDSAELHFDDTLKAAAGLGDPEAARVLVTEGPERVKELIDWGIPFDREGNKVALGREGAHSRRRILHAGGDATGSSIWCGLADMTAGAERIHLMPETMAVDLLVEENCCHGALVYTKGNTLMAVLAKVVVLASGGAGQLYPVSTNPVVATGDGISMAYRAGAEVMDVEFYQFHPTVLVHPQARGFLISEAVRGEGAFLRNNAGERFMPDYHPLAELAPRDVVSRAVAGEMERHGAEHIYLDLSHLDRGLVEHRFPNITSTCRRLGLDPHREWLPVAPAAHYFMGGVRTDLYGRTNIENLYAGGEVACSGVHGANRLASNSLLEGLVFGGRIAGDINNKNLKNFSCPAFKYNRLKEGNPGIRENRPELQKLMQHQVGLIRSHDGLKEAAATLERWRQLLEYSTFDRRGIEFCNMLTLAGLMVAAAGWRRESRGAHYRRDFPETEPAYRKRLVMSRGMEAREIPVVGSG